MTEMARTEYARMLRLLVLKLILKLMFSFHLPRSLDLSARITKFRKRPKITNGFLPNY